MPMNIQGTWEAHQDGIRSTVTFANIVQAGENVIGGSARYDEDSGTVTGSVSDRQVSLDVAWNGGARGRYNAELQLDGSLSGVTHDRSHADSHAIWYSINKTFGML